MGSSRCCCKVSLGCSAQGKVEKIKNNLLSLCVSLNGQADQSLTELLIVSFTQDVPIDQKDEVSVLPDHFQLVDSVWFDGLGPCPTYNIPPLTVFSYRHGKKLTVCHPEPVIVLVILDTENHAPGAVRSGPEDAFRVDHQVKI